MIKRLVVSVAIVYFINNQVMISEIISRGIIGLLIIYFVLGSIIIMEDKK